MDSSWTIAILAVVSIYCITRAIFDFRAKHYVWATFGLVCAGLILTMPIKTHAVKIDLPVPSSETAEQQSMRVEIFAGEILIGHSNLNSFAPPLGIAMGSFVPTDAYDRTLHANVFERDHISDRSKMLVIQSSDHGRIACDVITIEDYSDEFGEIDIFVIGIPKAAYESYFA